MKAFKSTGILLVWLISASFSLTAQDIASAKTEPHSPASLPQKVVTITGARFTYKLIERWIEDYTKVNPDVQIIVESRGSSDPVKYDILAEVFEQDEAIRKTREYVHVARYAVLPVATSNSGFARIYSDKGLNRDLIKQVFFHDIFADQEKQKPIPAPFAVYTRLQKAGVPRVFSRYFGHEQSEIKGIAIAGADSHLVKAVLRDSTGVTYLPLPSIFNEQTRKTIDGLTVLPVDINGNGKVSDDEKFYETLDRTIEKLENETQDNIKNIPIDYLHLSVDKKTASAEAIKFLQWVNENGQLALHEFGYLKPEAGHFENSQFKEFASRRAN